MWSLDFAYDDIYIRVKGGNAYPPEFRAFLNTLCNQWGLEKSTYARSFKRYKAHPESFKIRTLSESELSEPSY